MTALQTMVEVGFPRDLDQDEIDSLDHRLDAYRHGPGVTSLGITAAGPPPTRTVTFVCHADLPTQKELDRLAKLIVIDTLEDAGYSPDTLWMSTT